MQFIKFNIISALTILGASAAPALTWPLDGTSNLCPQGQTAVCCDKTGGLSGILPINLLDNVCSVSVLGTGACDQTALCCPGNGNTCTSTDNFLSNNNIDLCLIGGILGTQNCATPH